MCARHGRYLVVKVHCRLGSTSLLAKGRGAHLFDASIDNSIAVAEYLVSSTQ